MPRAKVTVTIFLIFFLSNVNAENLLKSTTSWDGGDIFYPEGNAEITSFILKLEEGEEVPYHCHPVPTMGYILKGNVQVETANGDKTILKEGQSAVEVMKTVHRGLAMDGPAEIIVFYAGAEDVPNTVLLSDEKAKQFCH